MEGLLPRPLQLDLKAKVTRIDKRDLIEKAFRWKDSNHLPLCGNSVYHSAISRSLLLKIRDGFCGRFFEFPVVDYDNAFKVILTGQSFYHVSRPFTIPGACPSSNSAATQNIAKTRAAVVNFNQDLGRDINDDLSVDDSPFRAGIGVTATIFATQHAFCRKYGFPHTGYEENLVRALVLNCEIYRDQESFDTISDMYREILASWHDGRYLPSSSRASCLSMPPHALAGRSGSASTPTPTCTLRGGRRRQDAPANCSSCCGASWSRQARSKLHYSARLSATPALNSPSISPLFNLDRNREE